MQRTAATAGILSLLLAAAPAGAQARRLVYDPRWPYHHADATPAEKALLDREIRHVAARVFREMACSGGTDGADVIDVAAGSFTRPGAAQRAIYYEWCRPATAIAAGGVVVVEGGRIVAHAVTGDWPSQIRRVPDLDGDGRDELLLVAGQTEQGETTDWATVLSLPPGRAVTRVFSVRLSECGTLDRGATDQVWPLYVVPGPRPRFLTQRLTSACERGTWRVRGGFVRPEPASGAFDRVR
jgi:hypothetical protein